MTREPEYGSTGIQPIGQRHGSIGTAPALPGKWMRFARWAQALSGRHERIAVRCSHVPMTLAQRRALAIYYQRRLNATWAIYPQIRLAIQPVLRQVISARSVAQERGPNRQATLQPGPPPAFERQEAGAAVGPEFVMGGRTGAGEFVASAARVRALAHGTAPPLERVLNRMNRNVRLPMMDKSLAAESRRMMQRVVEEHERIEDRARIQYVVRRAAGATRPETSGAEWRDAEAGAEQERDAQGGLVAWDRRSNRTWPRPLAIESPPMDLGRLADQVVREIDRRMVAHRERMGKVF